MNPEIEVKSGVSIIAPCDYCGESHHIRPWCLKKHRHHFCSTECKQKFQRERNNEYQRKRKKWGL